MQGFTRKAALGEGGFLVRYARVLRALDFAATTPATTNLSVTGADLYNIPAKLIQKARLCYRVEICAWDAR